MASTHDGVTDLAHSLRYTSESLPRSREQRARGATWEEHDGRIRMTWRCRATADHRDSGQEQISNRFTAAEALGPSVLSAEPWPPQASAQILQKRFEKISRQSPLCPLWRRIDRHQREYFSHDGFENACCRWCAELLSLHSAYLIVRPLHSGIPPQPNDHNREP